MSSTHPFVFVAMGTMVSLTSVQPLDRATQDTVISAFVDLEERFSLYRDDTEASRFARGELNLHTVSDAFRSAYDEAILWRIATGGAFTPHRPDGVVDLTGIIKAFGIRNAGRALREAGVTDWCLNAGGDVLTSGRSADGEAWVVGIVDPADRTELFTQFTTGDERWAVATSGIAERGEHIWRMAADDTFVQVTVCARDIVTADVLATAILAGGREALARAQELDDIDVLACSAGEKMYASRCFLAA